MTSTKHTQSKAAVHARSILGEMNQFLFQDLDKAKQQFRNLQIFASENSRDAEVISWYAIAASNFSSYLIDNNYSYFDIYIKILEDLRDEFPGHDIVIRQLSYAYSNAVWRFAKSNYDNASMYLEKVDEIYRNHPSNVTIAHSTCRTLNRFIEQADVTKRNDCIKAYCRLVQIASQYPHEREIQWFQLTAAFKIAEEETDPIEAMRYYQHVEQISNNKPDDKEIRSVASELGCIVLVKFGAGQFRDALEILETLERAAKKSNEWKEVYVSFATGTTCFIIKFSSEMPDLCENLYRKLQDFAQYYPDDDLIKYAMDAATESYRPLELKK